jgi:AP endonuclease-2
MKIVSWNVNSLPTTQSYHPWRDMTWKELLDSFDADIICFQETKLSRATALQETNMLVVPGYDAFHSFCRVKPSGGGGAGYSGVATYVRTERIPTPVDAEEGFLNVLKQKPPSRIGCYGDLESDLLTKDEMDALDAEGRCVITDHHLFVLFNVYFPNDGSDERHVYKMKFHRAIEHRIRSLLAAGRHVILLGDINTTHTELDHADPKKSMKESGIENYIDVPSRKWIHNLLTPNGPMVDTFRQFHPTRMGAFTCWNTKTQARDSNYGTRIDYVLVSEGIAGLVSGAEVEQKITGSDHCPITATLRDDVWVNERGTIVEEGVEGAKVAKLVDLLEPGIVGEDGKAREAPQLCAKFWDEFSGKQKKLSTFFAAKSKDEVAAVAAGQGNESPVDEVNGDSADRRGSVSQPAPSKPAEKTSWVSPSKAKKAAGKKKGGSQASGSGSAGQTSLFAFLGKPAAKSASPDPQSAPIRAPAEKAASQPPSKPTIPQPSPPRPLSPTSPFLVHNEPEVKQSWSSIFKPKAAPMCFHDEPAKEWVTNKPGPNKGRAFYLCQRPPGPEEEGTEKGAFGSKKRKGLKIGQYKCDFFA